MGNLVIFFNFCLNHGLNQNLKWKYFFSELFCWWVRFTLFLIENLGYKCQNRDNKFVKNDKKDKVMSEF